MSATEAKSGGVKRKAEEAPEGSPPSAPKKPFTIQEDLVDLAKEFLKSAGVISDAEAHALWESALDGPGVTQNEFATLEHILATYKFTDKARKYLSNLVTLAKSGKSIYKTIEKVRYDRSCLDLANHLVKDGKLDLADAKLIWEDVEDGPGVTECEKRTVEYVMKKHTLTEGAQKHFDEKLAAWKPIERKPIKPRKRNRTTKKFTIQIDLIQLAEEFKASAGVISDAEAHKLWQSALDGPGVTHNEFATLEYILSNYRFTDKARKYLENLVLESASGSSFYRMVNKVRYDRSCLDLADHLAKDGKIDLGDAKQLWEDVNDGNRVTVVEKRTLEHIMSTFTLTEGATTFLTEQLAALKPPPSATEKQEEKKAAEAAEAQKVSTALTERAIDLIWQSYDVDRSGDLDKLEAKRFVQDILVYVGNVIGYTDDGFEEMFASFDKDKNGRIDRSEMGDFIKNLMPC